MTESVIYAFVYSPFVQKKKSSGKEFKKQTIAQLHAVKYDACGGVPSSVCSSGLYSLRMCI